MPRSKRAFYEAVRHKALLWCDRHCCICGKRCGMNIEVAHLRQNSDKRLDNALPACFDCHAELGRYHQKHPRGRKYSVKELLRRREQVYEQHTAHLVPPLSYSLSQKAAGRILPDVGFQIRNLGAVHPVRVRVRITLLRKDGRATPGGLGGHYDGKWVWNLNPRSGVSGHFTLPLGYRARLQKPFCARVAVTAIDIYDREHPLLPVWYVHRLGPDDDWYLEPSPQAIKSL